MFFVIFLQVNAGDWRCLCVSVCVCVRVFCSIACNVTNSKQVHIDFDTGPTYQVSRRRAPGSSQQRLSVVRSLHASPYHGSGNSGRIQL